MKTKTLYKDKSKSLKKRKQKFIDIMFHSKFIVTLEPNKILFNKNEVCLWFTVKCGKGHALKIPLEIHSSFDWDYHDINQTLSEDSLFCKCLSYHLVKQYKTTFPDTEETEDIILDDDLGQEEGSYYIEKAYDLGLIEAFYDQCYIDIVVGVLSNENEIKEILCSAETIFRKTNELFKGILEEYDGSSEDFKGQIKRSDYLKEKLEEVLESCTNKQFAAYLKNAMEERRFEERYNNVNVKKYF